MEAGANKKEPKATEAKGGDEDLSMEEILQSIRRIIADDDNEGKKPVSDTGKNGKGKGSDDDVPGSDMLELTDMLKDDGTVVDLKKEAAGKAALAALDSSPSSFDILSQIDSVLDGEKPMAVEAPKPAAPVAPIAMPEPVAAAPMMPPMMAAPLSADSLLSDAAAAATAEAFSRLKNVDAPVNYATSAAPSFRSGATIEDMVGDMLRPMLKQWLDANLPAMVQQIVEREVKKLTR